jgi:hypothetical protein
MDATLTHPTSNETPHDEHRRAREQRQPRREALNGPVRLQVTAEHRDGQTISEAFTIFNEADLATLRNRLARCGFRIVSAQRIATGDAAVQVARKGAV